jgi:small GTP-binding protein
MLRGHSSSVSSIAFSNDGSLLASGSHDATIRLWEVPTGKLLRTFEGHNGLVTSVAFSKDGALLASGSRDATIRFWLAKIGKPLGILRGHSSLVSSVAFSNDGTLLASGSHDATIRLWESSSGKFLHTLEGNDGWVRSVSFSVDGAMLASATNGYAVQLWEVKTRKLLRALKGHTNSVSSVAFSIDGTTLASASDDCTIRLWEANGGGELETLKGHSSLVSSAAFSNDEALLLTGSYDSNIRLWEATSGKLLRNLRGHPTSVTCVAFSSDGATIASGSHDTTIKLWDRKSGELLRTLEGHKYSVSTAAFSNVGLILASGSLDQTVRLWEVASGNVLRILEGHHNSVTAVAFSNDGATLASASHDRSILLWEVNTGKLLHTLEDHGDWISSIAFSNDGALLASGSGDNRVRLWETKSGKLLRTLEGHSKWVRSLAFSDDGVLLASGSDDDTVRLWAVMVDEDPTIITVRSGYKCTAIVHVSPERELVVFGRTVFDEDDIVLAPLENPVAQKAAPITKILSAKIVLVGESSVGKSCLALRLVENRYEESGTTHGMRLWTTAPEALSPAMAAPPSERRDVTLWDLGGQSEYRLVHQLFLHETTIALMLFDPTRGEQAFQDIAEWNLRLNKQIGNQQTTKILLGAKCDQWPKGAVDKQRVNKLLVDCGIKQYIEISAKVDDHPSIAELRIALEKYLDWGKLASITRPKLFQRIRDALDERRKKGEVVIEYTMLEKEIQQSRTEDFSADAVNTVVKQLQGQGVLVDSRLANGHRALLLAIGYAETYAGSMILAARNNPRGVPALEVHQIWQMTSFPGMKESERIADRHQERDVLECVIELLLHNNICLSHEGMLVFPALFQDFSAEGDDQGLKSVSLFYDFTGAIDNIYSSLVVRLAQSNRFGRVRLAKNRAVFEHASAGTCAIYTRENSGGRGHLDLMFNEAASRETRQLFTVFVEDHLSREGVTIKEALQVTCQCGLEFQDRSVKKRIRDGHLDIQCPECETRNQVTESAKKVRNANPDVQKQLSAIRSDLEEKSKEEIQEVKRVIAREARQEADLQPIRILHLSDLHFGMDDKEPDIRLQALAADLKDSEEGLGFERLDYLVVSGDITERATSVEFDHAYTFLSKLIKEFEISAERCVIVPGNHDLSWETDVYQFKAKRSVPAKELHPGHFVEEKTGYLMRNNEHYPKRFENFQRFYHQLLQKPYPEAADQQFGAWLFEETAIQFLALNSAWQIDEHFPKRSSANDSALAAGLTELARLRDHFTKEGKLKKNQKMLRIAVWHHPVTGNEKIENDAFLEKLRKADFKVCLHGHVHEQRPDLIGHAHPRKLHVCGAGTFGAVAHDRPESTPRLYNLLEIDRDLRNMRVHTRAALKAGGAWTPWAVWPDKNNKHGKLSYYDVMLEN